MRGGGGSGGIRASPGILLGTAARIGMRFYSASTYRSISPLKEDNMRSFVVKLMVPLLEVVTTFQPSRSPSMRASIAEPTQSKKNTIYPSMNLETIFFLGQNRSFKQLKSKYFK